MKAAVFLLAGIFLLPVACDPRTRTSSIEVSGSIGEPKEMVRGSAQEDASQRMLQDQERELRQALAPFQGVEIQPHGRLLNLVLQADTCFSGDSDSIQPGFHVVLDRIAQNLGHYPQTLLQIEGHTDNAGTDSHNMSLSHQQAQAVKAALVQGGVDESRMQVLGFGRANPVAPNETEAGRRLNRRVLIKVEPWAGNQER